MDRFVRVVSNGIIDRETKKGCLMRGVTAECVRKLNENHLLERDHNWYTYKDFFKAGPQYAPIYEMLCKVLSTWECLCDEPEHPKEQEDCVVCGCVREARGWKA